MPRPAPDDNAIQGPAAPPPLLFLAFFLTGHALNRLVPLPFLPLGWNLIPAVLLSFGGAVILLSAVLALRRAGTPASPYRPARKLVTTGAYLRTRNPIYLAYAWIYLGFASWSAGLWPFALFPFLVFAVNRLVIAREEAALEARFGKAWREYAARTRRWM